MSYYDMIDNHYLPFNFNNNNTDTKNELQKVCKIPHKKGPEKKSFDILVKKVLIGGPSPVQRSNTTTTMMTTNTTAAALSPPAQHYYNISTPLRVRTKKCHYLAREAAETWG